MTSGGIWGTEINQFEKIFHLNNKLLNRVFQIANLFPCNNKLPTRDQVTQ